MIFKFSNSQIFKLVMGDTNINNKGKQQNTYDAIVIGCGISGGWAAKEFCEHGLKTLVLERGRNVVHIKDYPTATLAPWEFQHRGEMPIKDKRRKSCCFNMLCF